MFVSTHAHNFGYLDEAFKQQDKTLRRYLKPDLVIIDDMGLKALPKEVAVAGRQW